MSTLTNSDLRGLLEPYRHIFTIYTQYKHVEPISSVTETLSWLHLVISPTYTLHVSKNQGPKRGDAVFPPDTPPQIVRAFLTLDNCDLAVASILPHLRSHFQRRNIHAFVNWTQVFVLPAMQLRLDNGREDAVPRVINNSSAHSILTITGPGVGRNTFVVDLTVEQFGYDAEQLWFVERETYLGATSSCCERIVPEDEEDYEFEENEKKWKDAISEVCGGLEWGRLDGVERGERLRVVGRKARGVFGRVAGEIERGGNV